MNYDPVSNTSADQEARAMSRCAEAATDPTGAGAPIVAAIRDRTEGAGVTSYSKRLRLAVTSRGPWRGPAWMGRRLVWKEAQRSREVAINWELHYKGDCPDECHWCAAKASAAS